MSQVPFCGATYQGRSVNINSSRAVNFMPEATGATDDKAALILTATPGTQVFTIIPEAATSVRGMYTFQGHLFAVVGDGLYQVEDDGTYDLVDRLLTADGIVDFADNGLADSGVGGNQLIMVDGLYGYVYNVATSTFTILSHDDIVDPVVTGIPEFPATPKMVTYLDGYFVIIDGTMRFVVSDLYDGTTYQGLATAAVSSMPDNVQAVTAINNQLLFVKEFTTEVWYDAAVPTSEGCPFARVSGAVYNYGTPAPWSLARGSNSVFFVSSAKTNNQGSFFSVVQVTDYSPTVISTAPIAYKISQSTDISSCFAYCYADQGHMFYVLTNPVDDWTLVYDVTTQMWHERSSFDDGVTFKRHLSNCYVYYDGNHLVGGYTQPYISKMSTDYYSDNGIAVNSIRTAPHVFDNSELNSVFVSRLDVDAETGVGSDEPIIVLVTHIADGSWLADGTITGGGIIESTANPQAFLSWSNDGGHTWSNEYSCPMGEQANYYARLKWRRLGYSRNRVFKLRISDPVKRNIIGAYMRAST